LTYGFASATVEVHPDIQRDRQTHPIRPFQYKTEILSSAKGHKPEGKDKSEYRNQDTFSGGKYFSGN
jgi:hypothetical protein